MMSVCAVHRASCFYDQRKGTKANIANANTQSQNKLLLFIFPLKPELPNS